MAVKENLLQVSIFYSSLNERNIQEDIKYTTDTITYAVGGAISLYLGISLSMVFEVIEFFIDLLINLFFYCSGRKFSQ